MSEMKAYLNGRLIPVADARLPVWDLGVVMGATATEMMRTFRWGAYRVGEHLERLRGSIGILGLSEELGRLPWEEWIGDLVNRNKVEGQEWQEMGISAFVTAGPARICGGGRGGTGGDRSGRDRGGRWGRGRATACVHTFPLPYEIWAEQYERGQHLVTPQVRQIPKACLDPRLKTRSRAQWYIADRQAREREPEGIALPLSLEGRLTETATANLFVVRGGRVLTPSQGETLEGVSQRVVRELCGRVGLECVEADLWPEDLWGAEEAFTASTPSCLLPVVRYDGRWIGEGRPGTVYGRLLRAWSEEVGVDIASQMREGAGRRREAGRGDWEDLVGGGSGRWGTEEPESGGDEREG